MSISDVMLQNYMPRHILDSDDELDSWSLSSSRRSSSRNSSSSSSDCGMPFTQVPKDMRDQSDFCLFQDYFGLSNLLNNVKISEDNPLLYNTQKRAMQRVRRGSWSSDASSDAVLSPTIDSNNYDLRGFDGIVDSTYKQLPPPSMRLSKAMRDHIISGAYQQQINSREKTIPPQLTRPPLPPPPPSPPRQQPQPPPPPIMQNLSVPRQQSSAQVCVFCRNNGETESVYTSHVLKDADGRTSCPILRAYTCPICKANGDSSHTIKYCPMNQNARAGVMGHPPMSMGQRTALPPPQPRIGGFRPPLPMNLPPPPPLPGHGRLPPPPPGKHRL